MTEPIVGPADPDRLYTDLTLPEGPSDRPYVVVNMVSTADGHVRIDGTAGPIGSPLDKQLLRRLRLAADGLMHGAETVRAEAMRSRVPEAGARDRVARGLPPQPRPIVVTHSGNLPLTKPYFTDPGPRAIVVAPANLPEPVQQHLAAHADLLLTGGDEVDLAAAMRTLRQLYGLRHLVLEGGPTLNHAMLRADLIDELFWTIAPKLAGGTDPLTLLHGPRFPRGQEPRLHLISLYHHADELYTRYRISSP